MRTSASIAFGTALISRRHLNDNAGTMTRRDLSELAREAFGGDAATFRGSYSLPFSVSSISRDETYWKTSPPRGNSAIGGARSRADLCRLLWNKRDGETLEMCNAVVIKTERVVMKRPVRMPFRCEVQTATAARHRLLEKFPSPVDKAS